MARFVHINAGNTKLLCNLDCSIQHFLNYVEQKCDSMGRQSQNDGGRAESPGDHLGEDVSSTVTAAAATADNPKESTLKQTVVRAPGGKRGKQINLDECYMQFDVMDTDGQLMDLSLCNQRARVSDVLLHNFHYIFCRVYRERDAMKAVDCVNMSTHTVVWNAARQFKNARNAK